MSIFRVLTTLKNHWKKSTFAAGAFAYGISYSKEQYEIAQLMRNYCEEAVKYGDITIDSVATPKRILVILNPAANKKSAEKTFQKYCEPILHLAGFLVDIVRTDSEGHATRYIEDLEQLPHAILVAGGDGTISEAVTGLLRRVNQEKCPIGILPVGRTNAIAAKLYNLSSKSGSYEEIRGLADSAIVVVRGKIQKKNVMKIQTLDEKEQTPRPIYALGSLQWGAFRDVLSLRDKYWYVGPLREYASTLFNAFSDDITWKCKAKIIYTPPCPGCKNCFIKDEMKTISTNRWWSRFIPRFKLGQQSQSLPDYSRVVNDECVKQTVVEISPTEVILSPEDEQVQVPKLNVSVEMPIDSSFDFISKSWSRIRTNKVDTKAELEARTIELIPETVSSENQEVYYSIDNEAYEVRPIRISIVPKAIDLFTL